MKKLRILSAEMEVVTTELLLRLSATLVLLLTVSLLALDTQSKVIFYPLVRKVTFRDLNALAVLVYVDAVAAGYNLLQLLRCFLSYRFKTNPIMLSHQQYLPWLSFLLDQAVVYTVFAANSAATEGSILAVTGARSFQWMKLCNRFTRFCVQVGGALICGFVASFLLAFVSFISAFSLFRLYSPNRFLLLKPRVPPSGSSSSS
ncbi:CASP-like protein 2C1 [Diospyros lotus]|uniref:CASP-like protein 2C1 n=1 Tax=Diospyros lotus TaxID=55363 RepID=UPI00225088CE|nr:CASP-like protein 2C1 [Diospyros lotus]